MSANELIAIELQLKGYDGVMADFRSLDTMLNGFRSRKNKLTIESDLSKTKAEVIALQGELNKLKQAKNVLSEKGLKSDGLNNKIKETTERLRDAQQAVRELQYALKNLSSMSFTQVFNKISSAVAHLGSAMQSAGNALTRLTNPFANFTKGMVMGAGYTALGKFTEGLTSAFDRADIMRKYPRVMQAMGYTADEAQASINKLDQAVQGLPTKLDDIVGMAQRFTSTIGDMNRGTDLAIAANNAFLASMSTETQRYQGMMQLQDVIGGKKMNAREWYSLANSMMPAIRMMGESLGYEGKQLEEYVANVQQGKIANKEFLDTLVKAGTDSNGKIRTIAMEALDTWEALFSRIGTAASRLGYKGIIEPLNEMVETVTNGKFKSVNLLLDDFVINGIDKMTAGIRDWVKAHPQEITDFFKSLKSINFGSIIKGVGEAFQDVAKLVKGFADMFGGKDLSWLGKFMVHGNILGNALTITGGLLKGTRHLFGGLGAGGASILKTIKGIRKSGGLFKYISEGFVGSNPTDAKKAVDTVGKTAPKMAGGLSKFFVGWGQVMTMIGGTAFTGWASMKLIKGAVKSFKQTVDILNEVDWDMGKKALLGIGGFLAGVAGLSKLAGHFVGGSVEMLIGEVIVGLFTTIATGFAAIDMKLVKSTVKDLNKTVGYLKSAIDGLKELGDIADAKGSLDKASKAVEVFNDIRDVFKGKYDHFSGEMTSGLKGFGKGTTKSVENIAKTIGNMKKAIQSLNDFAKMDIDATGVEDVAPKMTQALSALRTAILAIPSEWKESGIVDATGNLSSSLGNVKKSFQNIVGKNGILGMIPKLVSQVEGIDQSGALLNLPSKMGKLGSALKASYDALNSGIGNGAYMSKNLDNFRQALKSAKFAVKHLQELGGMTVDDGVVKNIGDIFSKIKEAFNVDAINGIKEPIDTFVQTIRDALKAFEDFNTEIEINPTVKLGSGFQSSVNSSARQIRKAKGQIDSAVNSIPSNYYKTVTIHVAVRAIVSGVNAAVSTATKGAQTAADRIKATIKANSATGGRISRNGVLYRAGGGSIFKPRGTDTIPAMLSEGEYVHRKQAVDFFGTDFMRSVNNMDVRGAMKALLNKAGSATNIGRQSVVNNTVNNNQRITQNINTNNPSFANVRMGRFVGAL